VDILRRDGKREIKALCGANNFPSCISRQKTDQKSTLPSRDAKTNMRGAAS
jgi:hypothetical protein